MIIVLFSLLRRLTEFGKDVGSKLIDIVFIREKNYKREIKLLEILIFIKSNFWKASVSHKYRVFIYSSINNQSYSFFFLRIYLAKKQINWNTQMMMKECTI